jgi:hypothetical protein
VVEAGDLAVVTPGAQQAVRAPDRGERVLNGGDTLGPVGSQHADVQGGAHEDRIALDPDRLGGAGEEEGDGGDKGGEREQEALND